MDLKRVRWGDALAAMERSYAADPSAASGHLLAEASAFAALAETDYVRGRAHLGRAKEIEPLNPLHDVRRGLHDLRFGLWQSSADAFERLKERVPGAPLVEYARALALMGSGETDPIKKAGNVAETIANAVPLAGFLHVDARVRVQLKGVESRLQTLDRGAAHRAAWVDLLAKLVVLHPEEGPAFARKRLGPGGPLHGAPEAELLECVLAWSDTPADHIANVVDACPPDSARERLAMAVIASRLDPSRPLDVVRALRDMGRRDGDRMILRRWLAAALSRHASAEAAAERFGAALRAIERGIAAEPQEAVHYQNRAAVLTLMGDHETALDAWADLDRHQYRLALLGRVDASMARSLRRTHRMFAQQARMTPGGRAAHGVFCEDRREASGIGPALVRVNQSRIESDPEQLRQWIHNRAAELTFSHLALGFEAERFLLSPATVSIGARRLAGLAELAQSLAVLVPQEGSMLAERLVAKWRRAAAVLRPRYEAPSPDDEREELAVAYVETLGDFALLAFQYEPAVAHRTLVRELVAFGLALAPFFDEGILYVTCDERKEASTALRVLRRHVLDIHGDDDPRPPLRSDTRQRVVPTLCASILVSLALQEASAGELEHALGNLDRARELDPTSAYLEYRAAQVLLHARYVAEARKALARFHRLVKPSDDKLLERAEELGRMLKEQAKGEDRGPRVAASESTDEAEAQAAVQELEGDVMRSPGAIRAYEVLVRRLLADGRYDDATVWCEQAIRRCLSRQSQLRARTLQLEAFAIAALAPKFAGAVELYLAGVREPLTTALADLSRAEDTPYPVHYLFGVSLLAAGRPGDAGAAFTRALAGCTIPLHHGVLRALAADAEGAFLDQARAAIKRATAEHDFAGAWSTLAGALVACTRKEPCLPLAAVVSYESTIAGAPVPVAIAGAAAGAAWADRFAAAIALEDGLERTAALCGLASEQTPEGAREVAAVLGRVESARAQARVTQAVADASEALKRDDVARALDLLSASASAGEHDVQWKRLRVVAFLRAHRFVEADSAIDLLRASEHPDAAELVARYPVLQARYRIAAATRLVRENALDAADRDLRAIGNVEGDVRLDLAYARAFVLARLAARDKERSSAAAARAHLVEAIDLIGPQVPAARAAGRQDLLDLYSHLDDELAYSDGARVA